MTKPYIVVLCEDLYEENELWYPYYRLKEEGYHVELVGTVKKEYTGKNGLSATVDKLINDVEEEKVDAIIIPGGYAPDKLRRYSEVNALVKKTYDKGKVVAAICHGAWVMISAKILEGKTVTSFFAIRDDLENAGAIYKDEEVIQDGNIITSRTPVDLPAFLKTIISAVG